MLKTRGFEKVSKIRVVDPVGVDPDPTIRKIWIRPAKITPIRHPVSNETCIENHALIWREKKKEKTRDEDPDPDPVGSGDFWPAGSGSGTFFNGSGSGSYL